MAIETQAVKKPIQFAAPTVGASGALAGVFVGAANGSVLLGVVVGFVLLAAMTFLLMEVLDPAKERMAKWAIIALMAVAGFALGGIPGVVMGGLFGWFFGWFTYWIGMGRYRVPLAPYLTAGQVLWFYGFRVLCGAIFTFLITPILVVMPLSFNAEDFFTFTPEMLRFDPAGYSLKHYREFFTSSEWQNALKNSLIIAPFATLLSVTFGTLAAIGLSSEHVPFRRSIMAILIFSRFAEFAGAHTTAKTSRKASASDILLRSCVKAAKLGSNSHAVL